MSAPEGVQSSCREGALWLTIDRMDRANALDPQTIRTLHRSFAEPGDARMIVLTGAGDRAFCSGADLAGDVAEETARQFTDLLAAMDACPIPIIARVNGAVAGGGVGLICASDMAIGVNTLSIATPEARLGLFPFMILPYLLRVSTQRTVAEMAFAGRRLGAAEAVQAGFLTRCVAPDDLDGEIDSLCTSIAAMGPQALRVGRAAFARCAFQEAGQAPFLKEAFVSLWNNEESKEGRAAFREKRTPQWIKTDR